MPSGGSIISVGDCISWREFCARTGNAYRITAIYIEALHTNMRLIVINVRNGGELQNTLIGQKIKRKYSDVLTAGCKKIKLTDEHLAKLPAGIKPFVGERPAAIKKPKKGHLKSAFSTRSPRPQSIKGVFNRVINQHRQPLRQPHARPDHA